MPSGCILTVEYCRISFFVKADECPVACLYRSLPYSFVDGHTGCWHILAVANGAAVNLAVLICLRDLDFWSFQCTSRSGVAGDSSFNFFEEPSSCFSPQWHHFAFPPTVHVGSKFNLFASLRREPSQALPPFLFSLHA